MSKPSSSIPRLETLAPRERQIVEAVYRLGEAGVAEILRELPDPPSYSAVRAILSILVQKGFLRYRREKLKYLYRPVLARDDARRSVLRNLLDTFFAGSATEVVAALLDVAEDDLEEKDFHELKHLIENARKGGR